MTKQLIILFCLSLLPKLLYGQALQTEWATSLGGSLYEQSNGIAIAPCGDVYMVGYFQQQLVGLTATGGEDGFIAKLSANGDLQWVKSLEGTSSDRINGIAIANDEQLYIRANLRGFYIIIMIA